MPPSLQAAVASGDVALATTLVDASLTSNGGAHASRNMAVMDRAGDMMWRTALHIASESGHGVMVEWLLTQCQAEANARAREEAISAESAAKDAVADAVRAEKDKEVRAVRAEASEKEFELDSANEIIAGLNRESERSKREWNDARKALDA